MMQFIKVQKYFCVSTDKAANPVNMMGASKRIMEKFLIQKDLKLIYQLQDLQMLPFQMDHCCMALISGS